VLELGGALVRHDLQAELLGDGARWIRVACSCRMVASISTRNWRSVIRH
jgi:hypothetical protein